MVYISMLTVECRMKLAMRWTAICCLLFELGSVQSAQYLLNIRLPAAAVRMRLKLVVPR